MRETLAKQTVIIFGASGTVGSTAALIAATQHATVQLVAHRDVASMQTYADKLHARYDVKLQVVDGTSDTTKKAALAHASVVICTAVAGVRVLKTADFMHSSNLKIMADVNAVAPSGIEGVQVMSDGEQIKNSHIVGIGALAIGQLKYKTQQQLLQKLLTAEAPQHLNYQHAFAVARDLI
jgi:methylene-tetrahydromethanopterin dehydrogenase